MAKRQNDNVSSSGTVHGKPISLAGLADLAEESVPEYEAASESDVRAAIGYGTYRFRKLINESTVRQHRRKGYSGRMVKYYSIEDIMKAIAGA